MLRNHDGEITVRRYLLGQLAGDSQHSVEERLMTEKPFLEEMEVAEGELIDAYLSGKLTNEEYERFEQHFLTTPERKRKLRFAKTLHRYVATNRPDHNVPATTSWTHLLTLPTWPTRIAAFAILLVVVVGFWIYRNRSVTPQNFAAITISISSSTRGESAPPTRVELPRNVDALKIALLLPDGSTSVEGYRVELVNDLGESRPLDVASQDARYLTVVIPASQLDRGQYALKLFARTEDGAERRVNGSYFFTVE